MYVNTVMYYKTLIIIIIIIINGSRQYSSDLPQGGLELPCTYAFVSDNQRLLQKARKRLEEEGTRVAYVTQGGNVASVVGLATNKIESSISTACTNTNNIAPVTSAVTKNDTSATVTKLLANVTMSKWSIHMLQSHCSYLIQQ